MANKRLLSLTRRSDFLRLKERGRTVHVTSWLLVNFERTTRAQLRCGWTIPAYVGVAVTRNRLRRWGREFLRAWAKSEEGRLTATGHGLDVNFVFKRGDKTRYKAMGHGEFTEAMEKSVEKLGRHLA